jgi:hypothetical protein
MRRLPDLPVVGHKAPRLVQKLAMTLSARVVAGPSSQTLGR